MIRFWGDKRLLCMEGNYGAVPSVAKEFAGLAVSDVRLQKRVEAIVERLSAKPDVGFPRAMHTHAEQEAFYRLMRNDVLDYRVLMEAHAKQTVERMTPGAVVRVVHDTTELTFSGESQREGLGRTRSKTSNGLFAHVALALTADHSCRPLGVVDMNCWARTGKSRGNRKMSGFALSKDPHRESLRWPEGVDACEGRIADRCAVVHIMDREGDNYSLFYALLSQARRFVIRLARDRVVSAVGEDETMPLSEALYGLECRVPREVALGRRKANAAPRSAKTHPARTQRTAMLALRSGRLEFRRPKYLADAPETIEVNVVYVEEIGTPDDADPVSWVLVTSEPVATAEEAEAVVDHYRARWLIEELFMALKTGCAVESASSRPSTR